MSGTLKVTTLQDGASSTANLTFDSSANATVGGTLAMASSFLRNRVINGNMVTDQRNAGASVTPTNGSYTLDRWGCYAAGSATGKYTVQQNAGSVTPPTGYKNYLGVTSTSAYSVAAGDITSIYQIIEGYNVADLGIGSSSPATFTLSFWVRSSLTGTFSGAFKNGSTTRSYPFTYTISAANTWEQKTVTVVGDTTGTWNTTNGQGLFALFSLGTGTTYSTTAGAWAAGDYYAATGAVSVVGTSGATFYITGVQLEVGTKATPYEMQIYSDQLAQCQRYYTKLTSSSNFATWGSSVVATSSTIQGASIRLPVTMRSNPTITFATVRVYDGSSASAISSITSSFSGPEVLSFDAACSPAVLTAYRPGMIQSDNSTAGYIAASAEL